MTTESTEEKTWMRIGIQIAEELFLLCCQLSYHETQLDARLWLTEDQAVCWIPRLNEIQRVGLERPCSRREVHKHLHSYVPAARVPKKQPGPKHAKGSQRTRRPEEQGAQSKQAALGHESNEANVDCVTPGTGKHGQQKTSLKNPANTISIS